MIIVFVEVHGGVMVRSQHLLEEREDLFASILPMGHPCHLLWAL